MFVEAGVCDVFDRINKKPVGDNARTGEGNI